MKRPRPISAASSSSGKPVEERGGARQRAAKRNLPQVETEAYVRSILAFKLTEAVMWGLMPANLCQQVAQWAVMDGPQHPEVVRLAELGSSGRHQQNIYHGLSNMIRLPCLAEALMTITIPVRKSFSFAKGLATKTLLLPHLLFAQLYKCHENVFRQRFLGGSADNIPEFWASQQSHPSLDRHPMTIKHRLGDYKKKGIPIGVHGDGVATTAVGKSYSKSVEGYSFQSLLMLGHGNIKLINFLICMIFKDLLEGGVGTQDEIWLVICWSLYWAYEGVYPTHDYNGKRYTSGIDAIRAGHPLAGGFFLVVWAIRGDLEYMLMTLYLRNYNSKTPCNLCPANCSNIPWTDARRNQALWLDSIWSNSMFAANFPNRHRIWRLPGVGIANYTPDWLHTKWLSTDAWFYGSTLDLLCRFILPGSYVDNLNILRSEIDGIYNELHLAEKLPKLTMGMFRPRNLKKFPCLKGRGGMIKYFGYVLEILFERHIMDSKPGAAEHDTFFKRADIRQWVLWSLQISNKLNKILDQYSKAPSMSATDNETFIADAFRFCGLVTLLGDAIHPKGIALFNYTIKFHYLLHIALITRYQNPLIGSCSQGEMMMKIVKTLAFSCSRSNSRERVTNSAMQKYVKALELAMLEDNVPWLR